MTEQRTAHYSTLFGARVKTKHYAGEVIGHFILTGGLGNPDLGEPMYWGALHLCGRVRKQPTSSLHLLEKLKSCCRDCAAEQK